MGNAETGRPKHPFQARATGTPGEDERLCCRGSVESLAVCGQKLYDLSARRPAGRCVLEEPVGLYQTSGCGNECAIIRRQRTHIGMK